MNQVKKQVENREIKWNEVRDIVLSHFDLDDPAVRAAVAMWEEQRARLRDYLDVGIVEHDFTSPEVLQAAIEYFKADIEENIAIYRRRMAIQQREKARAEVKFALGEHDGFFLSDESPHLVVPEHLVVVRITEGGLLKLNQMLVDRARELAENPDKNWQDYHWVLGLHAFGRDLDDFLRIHGEEGRAQIIAICRDHKVAREVLEDEQLEKPVRALAKLVVGIADKTVIEDKTITGFRVVA